MPVTTSGAEFKRFYTDQGYWPEDAWHEDSITELIEVNGAKPESDVYHISDDDEVKILNGVVLLDWDGNKSTDFVAFFKKWLKLQTKLQTTRTLRIEVNASKFDELMAAIKRLGGKVL